MNNFGIVVRFYYLLQLMWKCLVFFCCFLDIIVVMILMGSRSDNISVISSFSYLQSLLSLHSSWLVQKNSKQSLLLICNDSWLFLYIGDSTVPFNNESFSLYKKQNCALIICCCYNFESILKANFVTQSKNILNKFDKYCKSEEYNLLEEKKINGREWGKTNNNLKCLLYET